MASSTSSSESSYATFRTQTTNRTANSWISASALSKQLNPLQIFSAAFRILYGNQIAGPYLVRLEREFNLCAGEGGEGTIYEAAVEFDQKLTRAQESVSKSRISSRIVKSSSFWQRCVIKRLRYDSGRDLISQITSAYSEINLLSREPFKSHPNIVRLQGWGLCLDSLENPHGNVPRLPLLILEKASWDMKRFLQSPEYEQTSYLDLCSLSLGIGRGLGVLHTAGITHGDMKLTNVLLAMNTEYAMNDDLMKCRWTPRLCDFGLATSVHEQDDHGKAPMYRGTQGWRPLEAYLDKPPESLVSCDIFAYGLIIWALFTGKPTSPLPPEWNKEDERESVIEMIGQQKVYGRASKNILKAHGLDKEETEVYHTLRELTERAVNFAPGYRRKAWSVNIRRKAFFEGSREERQAQVNRILFVLKESLKDNPSSRGSRPWKYMHVFQYPNFKEPRGPPLYSAKPELMTEKARILHPAWLRDKMSVHVAEKLKTALWEAAFTYRRSLRQLGHTIITFLPFLAPRSMRQQIYEDWFSKVALPLRPRGGSQSPNFRPNDIGPLDHDKNQCHSLYELYYMLDNSAGYKILKRLQNWIHNLAGPDSSFVELRNIHMDIQTSPWVEHEFYAFARLHSRFKLCCWEKHQRELQCSSVSEEAIRREMSIFCAFSMLRFSDPFIWLCRGEIALKAVDSLKQNPLSLWAWLNDVELSWTETQKRMLLYLDLGCDIEQELCLGNRPRLRTIFRIYIERVKLDAIPICQQFRRIAADEYVSDQYRFFLTGQPPDVQGDDSLSEHNPTTTALHEAVRAKAYHFVECLVRSGFVATATARGQTALDVAVQMKSQNHVSRNNAGSNSSSDLHHIIALLQQSAEPLVRGRKRHNLPIGWTAIALDKLGTVYQEDSIDSDVAALTFVKPSYGLLQDRRLALGYRKIANQNHTYYLDPIRFLKSHASISDPIREVTNATEATFTDSWYLENIEETRKRPTELRQDSRRWYRVIVAIGAFIEKATITVAGSLLFWSNIFLLSCLGLAQFTFLMFSFCLGQLKWTLRGDIRRSITN